MVNKGPLNINNLFYYIKFYTAVGTVIVIIVLFKTHYYIFNYKFCCFCVEKNKLLKVVE